MNRVTSRILQGWVSLGPRFLPFADVATPDLTLGRLLRLSLFQVSVGMAIVLLVGTLNRVMIVELGVSASVVAVMLSLPVIFAPFRALIGFRSDTYHSALGWRRVPFIWKGSMIQFGGLALMPFALLVLSGGGNASQWPGWIGHVAAGISFLLVGAGLHTTQTAGLALATDLVPEDSQPKVVGLMYIMLLIGTVASAMIFGWLLEDFSPGKLVSVIQGSAVATLIINTIALWKQETRRPRGAPAPKRDPSFMEAWESFRQGANATRRMVALGLGTMAFSMQDILLEPYGGQVLGMSVAQTTQLTATLAFGTLLGFWLASRVLGRGGDPSRVASAGALVGVAAFTTVILASSLASTPVFVAGAFLIGFGAGLFGHGTLTSTMNHAPAEQRGLALGTWGAVQATAAGVAVATGGILRDVVSSIPLEGGGLLAAGGATFGYTFVYSLEITLLFATLVAMLPLLRRESSEPAPC